MHWRNEKHHRRKYDLYMNSREWQLKKRKVKERSGGVCERCRDHSSEAVHHLHYKNLFNEPLEDLLDVCKGCHDYVHARSDKDPVTEHIQGGRWERRPHGYVLEKSQRADDVLSKIAEEYSWEKSEYGLPLRFVLRSIHDVKGTLEVGIWVLRGIWGEGINEIEDGGWFYSKDVVSKDHQWLKEKAGEIWERDHEEYSENVNIRYYIIPETDFRHRNFERLRKKGI